MPAVGIATGGRDSNGHCGHAHQGREPGRLAEFSLASSRALLLAKNSARVFSNALRAGLRPSAKSCTVRSASTVFQIRKPMAQLGANRCHRFGSTNLHNWLSAQLTRTLTGFCQWQGYQGSLASTARARMQAGASAHSRRSAIPTLWASLSTLEVLPSQGSGSHACMQSAWSMESDCATRVPASTWLRACARAGSRLCVHTRVVAMGLQSHASMRGPPGSVPASVMGSPFGVLLLLLICATTLLPSGMLHRLVCARHMYSAWFNQQVAVCWRNLERSTASNASARRKPDVLST